MTPRFSLQTLFLSVAAWSLAESLQADDTAKIAELFASAADHGGVVTIPPGDYQLDGAKPLSITSNTSVVAYGARFHLPTTLPDKARLVLFAGEDIAHFTWQGGEFLGHVFDPAQKENSWEPNANTKGIEITTTKEGATHDILFRDVKSNGIAGAVIGVHGLGKKGSESEVLAQAERVAVESCTLLRSGKFMWDYGYLWQIMTWPEEYEAWEVDRAKRYFRTDKLRENVQMSDGDDHVRFDNNNDPVPVSRSAEPSEVVTFMGASLPKNIMRGKQYFVVESDEDYIKIADEFQGAPLRFQGNSGAGTALVKDMSAVYLAAYAPVGSGPGKGAFDITGTRDVRVTGCQLSAIGDTMHIQRCQNVIFANNHIIGSRMGAFFLAEYCKNATISGNLVDGTNGSRVISVEKSSEDVTMTGNTFRNGGRGSWINQPKNFILQGNVFVNNTTKGEADMHRGRRSYKTGEPVRFPELYFTLHQTEGTYGPVIVRDNIFALGDSVAAEAVTFAPSGHDLQMTGNTFQNHSTPIVVDPSCTNVDIRDNQGAELKREAVDFQHGKR